MNKLSEVLNISDYEARIYESALNLGLATLTDIAKHAEIPRTATYPPLQSLVKRGLISPIAVKKRTHYQALEPKQLQFMLEKKQIDLNAIITELSKNILATKEKLAINYYPGANGIALAGDIFLNETKTKLWKTFEQPLYTAKTQGAIKVDEYVEKRVEKKIHARMIIPANLKSDWIKEHLAHDKEELRETILVSPEIYPLEASIGVTDGMVILISARNNHFALLIKNNELAETISSIHDMVWDRYRIS